MEQQLATVKKEMVELQSQLLLAQEEVKNLAKSGQDLRSKTTNRKSDSGESEEEISTLGERKKALESEVAELTKSIELYRVKNQ